MTSNLAVETNRNTGGKYVLHGPGPSAAVNEVSGGSARLLHNMLRVRDLGHALDFYTGALGMRVLRQREFSEDRYTLAFLGYVDEGRLV